MVKEAAKIKRKIDFLTWDRKGRKQEREVDNGNEASKLITRIFLGEEMEILCLRCLTSGYLNPAYDVVTLQCNFTIY